MKNIKALVFIFTLLCILLITMPCLVSAAPKSDSQPVLKLDKVNLALDKNELINLQIRAANNFATSVIQIEWSSNKSSVATVSKDGTVKGISQGKAVITAKVTGQNVYAQAFVTVSNKTVADTIYNKTYSVQAIHAIENYSPTSDLILKRRVESSHRDKLSLIKTWEKDNVFDTISVGVHEIMHENQFSISDFDSTTNSAHLINGTLLNLEFNPEDIFRSEELNKIVPEENRSFRWFLYLSEDSTQSANVDGIYGLLDEFEAYYYGDRSVYDVYPYFVSMPYKTRNFVDYYNALGGQAFYEFQYFTLSYLIYAKKYYPTTYASIMNNKEYRAAFRFIYTKYKYYNEVQIPNRMKELISILKKHGVHASFQNDIFTMGRMSYFSNDVGKVKKELNIKPYQDILKELIKP